MKVAITSQGKELDSQLDERFGRCAYFVLMDLDTGKYEVVENSGADAFGGAGIQAAQFLADRKAEVLITGQVGPNAARALNAAGVQIYSSEPCSVREAIDRYRNNRLQKIASATVDSHFGLRK